eukprot:TRINITY_DN56297_c0_g1_i1.p1 TRINITY_DN56297_c0_g1~~TRINITY_DN56297_c0_g1_i1.p1  ORF type:complete len:1159 (-),score=150.75 TRINITY_DN56297_c0_g1_i1:200-3676(-)
MSDNDDKVSTGVNGAVDTIANLPTSTLSRKQLPESIVTVCKWAKSLSGVLPQPAGLILGNSATIVSCIAQQCNAMSTAREIAKDLPERAADILRVLQDRIAPGQPGLQNPVVIDLLEGVEIHLRDVMYSLDCWVEGSTPPPGGWPLFKRVVNLFRASNDLEAIELIRSKLKDTRTTLIETLVVQISAGIEDVSAQIDTASAANMEAHEKALHSLGTLGGQMSEMHAMMSLLLTHVGPDGLQLAGGPNASFSASFTTGSSSVRAASPLTIPVSGAVSSPVSGLDRASPGYPLTPLGSGSTTALSPGGATSGAVVVPAAGKSAWSAWTGSAEGNGPAKRCPKGQCPMRPARIITPWSCDVCGADHAQRTIALTCFLHDYNICALCLLLKREPCPRGRRCVAAKVGAGSKADGVCNFGHPHGRVMDETDHPRCLWGVPFEHLTPAERSAVHVLGMSQAAWESGDVFFGAVASDGDEESEEEWSNEGMSEAGGTATSDDDEFGTLRKEWDDLHPKERAAAERLGLPPVLFGAGRPNDRDPADDPPLTNERRRPTRTQTIRPLPRGMPCGDTGLDVGDVVTRGPHWLYPRDYGRPGDRGVVAGVVPDAPSFVIVVWETTGITGAYEVSDMLGVQELAQGETVDIPVCPQWHSLAQDPGVWAHWDCDGCQKSFVCPQDDADACAQDPTSVPFVCISGCTYALCTTCAALSAQADAICPSMLSVGGKAWTCTSCNVTFPPNGSSVPWKLLDRDGEHQCRDCVEAQKTEAPPLPWERTACEHDWGHVVRYDAANLVAAEELWGRTCILCCPRRTFQNFRSLRDHAGAKHPGAPPNVFCRQPPFCYRTAKCDDAEQDADVSATTALGSRIDELPGFDVLERRDKPRGFHTQLLAAFQAFDSDGSGSVDFNELCRGLGSIGLRIPRKALREVFDKVDTNASGSLSLDEFIAVAETYVLGNVGDKPGDTGALAAPRQLPSPPGGSPSSPPPAAPLGMHGLSPDAGLVRQGSAMEREAAQREERVLLRQQGAAMRAQNETSAESMLSKEAASRRRAEASQAAGQVSFNAEKVGVGLFAGAAKRGFHLHNGFLYYYTELCVPGRPYPLPGPGEQGTGYRGRIPIRGAPVQRVDNVIEIDATAWGLRVFELKFGSVKGAETVFPRIEAAASL